MTRLRSTLDFLRRQLAAALRFGGSIRSYGWIAVIVGTVASPTPLQAQDVRIRDLTVSSADIPWTLQGYGLVLGLDGTGDRVIGGFSSGHTVQSVANLLRREGIEVPENELRTRNVAAVMVTAEVSAFLRPGGRFNVAVSSLGDATSLRGGVLIATPLRIDPQLSPVGVAQGPIQISEALSSTLVTPIAVETSATMPSAGILEQPLPESGFEQADALHLREPDFGTATRIATAINAEIGEGAARIVDPGSIALALPTDDTRFEALARIQDLTVSPDRAARIVIDSRNGTVVAGGGVRVGEAVVSHGGMTLAIGGVPEGAPADPFATAGDLRVQPGAFVQEVAAALHAVAAPPEAIAAVFNSLREVGAITAQVVVR